MIKIDKEASRIEGTGVELLSECVTAVTHVLTELCEDDTLDTEAMFYALIRTVIHQLNENGYGISRERIGMALFCEQ